MTTEYRYNIGNLGDAADDPAEIERYETILQGVLEELHPEHDWRIRGQHAEGVGPRNYDLEADEDVEIGEVAWSRFCE